MTAVVYSSVFWSAATAFWSADMTHILMHYLLLGSRHQSATIAADRSYEHVGMNKL